MNLAEVFVQIGADLKPFQAGLARVRTSLMGFANTPLRIPGGGMLGMLGGVGLGMAAVSGIRKIVSAASDLNESANMAKVVFGDSFGTIGKFADEMAAKFGLVKSSVYEATSSFGAFATGKGFSLDAAAAFSKQFTKLSADLSSAKNISFDESMIKLQAALSGEAEPLRRYGVDILEATVKNYAYTHSIAAAGAVLTEQQKVMARSALITRGLGFATGDLDRTIGDFANASRAGAGRFENLAAAIGTMLMPAFDAFQSLINEVLIDFTSSVEGMKSGADTFVGYLKSAIGAAGFVYRNFSDVVALAGVEIAEKVTNVGEVFGWLGDTVGAFLDWFGANWKSIFADAFTFVTTELANLGKNFQDLGTAFLKWIKDPLNSSFEFKFTALGEGMPELKTPGFRAPELNLSDFDEQRRAIGARMEARQREHDDKVRAAAGLPPRPDQAEAEAAGGAMAKAVKAEIIKSADLASAIAKSAIGQKNVPEQQLAAQEATNDKLDDANENLSMMLDKIGKIGAPKFA